MIYILLTLCAELLLAYVIVAVVLAYGLWNYIHRTTPKPDERWYVYLWAIVWPIPIVCKWWSKRWQ